MCEQALRCCAHQQRTDEKQTDDRALGVAAYPLQAEHIANGGHEQKRPEYTREFTLATEHADAAEQRNGDDVELEAERVVGPGVGDTRGKDDRGES